MIAALIVVINSGDNYLFYGITIILLGLAIFISGLFSGQVLDGATFSELKTVLEITDGNLDAHLKNYPPPVTCLCTNSTAKVGRNRHTAYRVAAKGPSPHTSLP